MGIADGKYALLFCLGFLSALAVSRVRVWTLAVLPFSGFVFVFGLVVGASRGGVAGDLLMKIGRNRESGGLSHEKMRAFGKLLEKLGVKLSEFEIILQRFADLNHVEPSEMERYLQVANSVSLATVAVKKFLQDSAGNDLGDGSTGDDCELEVKSNPTLSKRRRVLGMLGGDVLQFLAAMFQEVLSGKDSCKTKDNIIRKEAIERLNSVDSSLQAGQREFDKNTLANSDKWISPGPVPKDNHEDAKVKPLPKVPLDDRLEISGMPFGNIEGNSRELLRRGRSDVKAGNPVSSAHLTEKGNKSSRSREDSCDHDVLSDKEYLHILNRDFRLMSMQESIHKVVLQHKDQKTEIGRQQHMHDNVESQFNSSLQENEIASFSTKANTSLRPSKTGEVSGKAYFRTNDKINGKIEDERDTQTFSFREKGTKSEVQTGYDQHSEHNLEASNKSSMSSSSSAATSTRGEFNHIVKHGIDLLRQAGEHLKGKNDEKNAEILLYRSARLLSDAVAMKPRDLLALGQLGNTCLLHGELKLKISRDLRSLLSRNDPSRMVKRRQSQFGEQSNQFLDKEKLAAVLVDVCEECEELLIEAGRNYRMVLSIEGNDIRALYNWGLALSFRAQLISDIGPDAAFDADKVYLAAIDKFDAMLSRSNDYAPDALYRWGVALWQRSYLRPRNSSEKIKLLQQARGLFEDVLQVDSGYPHVREALRSCLSELNISGHLE